MAELEKLTGFIGAALTGLDLKDPISPETSAFLSTALADHGVLVIRDQHLDLAQQKRVTAAFGPVMRLPYVAGLEDDADVIAVLKEADEVNSGVFGGAWHSDFSFLESPPAGSVLNAVEIPPYGGDTVWACQAAAYASLPAHLKRFLAAHDAIHVGKPYGVKYAPPEKDRANSAIKMTRGDPAADREMLHPSVVTDPASGREALFLNPIYTTRFDGLTEAESAPFLEQIYQHCTRPDFCYRHRWQAGDLLIWDNRMTLHYATNDYAGHRRLLYRTTFAGARPAGATRAEPEMLARAQVAG